MERMSSLRAENFYIRRDIIIPYYAKFKQRSAVHGLKNTEFKTVNIARIVISFKKTICSENAKTVVDGYRTM